MRIHAFLIMLILFASTVISLPLFKPGLYSMHDDQQIARLFLFDEALKSGQFPPRWVSLLGFGYGYPLFVFYPPLAYITGELFHLLGFNFTNSIKIVFFLSIFLSGVAMYVLVKELWGKFSGLVAALFYIFAPYRAVDVYIRGALAESLSFIWPPLILWAYLKLKDTNHNFYILICGTLLALLMITHNLIFLPFIPVLGIFISYLLIDSKNKKEFIGKVFLSGVIGSAFSAFFWMPALFEKSYTIVDDLLLVNLANYNLHFLYPQQLWNWQWGFGGSGEGLTDGISFKIGKIHVFSAFLAAFLASYIYVFREKSKIAKKNFKLAATFLIILIFSAFMTTHFSKYVWDIFKPLQYLQFPWRFLTFCVLSASILTGLLIGLLRITVLKIVFASILLFLVVFPNLKLFKPQFYRENLTDESATNSKVLKREVSFSSFEYLPKGVELVKNEKGANVADINKSPDEIIQIENGSATVDNLTNRVDEINFKINAQTQAKLKANIFDFPNWEVLVDKQPASHSSNNKLKIITFDVPQGEHQISLKFNNTHLRSTANAISTSAVILSLFTFTGYALLKRRKI